MGYSNELYLAAADILKKRRKKAIAERESRHDEVRRKCPELLRIEREMSEAGLAVTGVLLRGGNVEEQIGHLHQTSIALQMERAELLRINGLPTDYLDLQFFCRECEDTGFVNGKICKCHLDLLRALTVEKLNGIAPLDESTFKRFDVTLYSNDTEESGITTRTRMRMIKQFCMDYAQTFCKTSSSIFMSGETGLGKTHLSLAIANEVIARGYSVEYGSAQNIFSMLEQQHFSRVEENKGRYERLILNTDLLIIDDLGAEFCTQFTVSALYNIVNTRLLRKKPLIINTNVTAQEMEEKYTRRITSRIFGNYELLGFEGKDVRQIKALSN